MFVFFGRGVLASLVFAGVVVVSFVGVVFVVMLVSVQLARLGGVMGRMSAVAGGGMGVVGSRLDVAAFVVVRSFPVVLGGLLMVIGGERVVLGDGFGRIHVGVPLGQGRPTTTGQRKACDRAATRS